MVENQNQEQNYAAKLVLLYWFGPNLIVLLVRCLEPGATRRTGSSLQLFPWLGPKVIVLLVRFSETEGIR